MLALGLLSTSSATAAGCAPSASDAYSGAVLADAPLAYFRNDEAGGSTLCDSAALPHDGSYFGGVSFGTAGALADGDPAVTATAGVGTAGPGVSGNHDFTLEGWFRRTTTTQNQALVAMGAEGAGHIAGLTLWTTTTGSYPITAASTLALDTYSGTNQWDTAAAGVNIWDGQWHYAAISYSAASGQATAYIDGHSLGAKAPQPLNITVAPIMIGKWVDSLINQPLIGSVDEIAVYPTALSATRVAAHYAAAGAGASPPPPPGMHSSTMQIICNYDVASSQDICTATVGDPSVAPISPTGTVKFTSASGGSFPFGPTCTLIANPASGATTSCSVQFIPLNFPAVFPHLTASYAGDAKHTSSSGSTFFGGLGKANEPAPPTTSVKQEGENQISIEVDVPVAATAVTACALSGGAGASAAGLIGSISKEIAAATEPLTRDVGRTTGGAISTALSGALNGELENVAGGLGQLQQSLGAPFSSPAPPLSLPALESVLKTLVEKEKAQPVDVELRAALKQVEADQADVSKLLQNMQSQCRAAAGAIGSSLAASVAKKHHKRGRALATVRRRGVAAGRLHLRLRISSTTLKKLAKGRKHLTLTVPVNMILPSKRFSQGFPLLSVQHVTLDLSKHKRKRKSSAKR